METQKNDEYDCVVYSYIPVNLDTARLEAFVSMILFMSDIKENAFIPTTVEITKESGEKVKIEIP